MKQEWFTSQELADAKLLGMPATRQGIELFIERNLIRRTDKARLCAEQGGGYEYHYSALPLAAQQKLTFLHNEDKVPFPHVNASNDLWPRFELLSKRQKQESRKRFKAFTTVLNLVEAGVTINEAVEFVSTTNSISRACFFEWRKMFDGHKKSDWLAVLALGSNIRDASITGPTSQECHPEAWTILKSDYLRPERPSFSSCYRRMVAVALDQKWSPIPSERSLRRKFDLEVPKAAQILAREGKKRAAQLYPAQKRSVAGLHAMEVVNIDGHQLDLFVKAPWSDTPVRVILIAIQDVYSRKFLGWTLSEAETWEAVRVCIGAMIENHDGLLPYHIYMDNGRAFASKLISGGAKTRHRFKAKQDDVTGILTALGIEPHFVKPYSGQSKPIERAWKDLAEEITRHPSMSGCYTGSNPQAKPENYGSRAVALDQLQLHVARCIDEHNSRQGRVTEMAHGRSFNDVFNESLAHPSTILRYATMAQRSLWMLSAGSVTARKPDGAVYLHGNRYWHSELNNWIGKKLTVRFDPANLHNPIKIYTLDERFLCDAECLDSTGFADTGSSRQHEKKRKTHIKNLAATAKSHAALTPMELGEIMEKGHRAANREKPTPRPVVTRLITRSSLAQAQVVEAIDDNETQLNFARALSRIEGGGSAIIPFPQGDQQAGVKPARKSKADK